jgi:periplasmic mercuric ion binding protein
MIEQKLTQQKRIPNWRSLGRGSSISIKLILAFFSTALFAQNEPVKVSDILKIQEPEPIEVVDGHKIEIKTSAICNKCKETLESNLAIENGVEKVTLNLDDKVLTIIYNAKITNPKNLRSLITKVGYHADWIPRDSIAYNNLALCCKDGAQGTPIPQVPIKRKDNN